MIAHPTIRDTKRRAFTITEVLLATAILAIVVTMAASLVNSAAISTNTAERRLDTAEVARTVFDRMLGDLETLVWSGKATLVVGSSNNGTTGSSGTKVSDSLAFLCRSRTIQTPGDDRENRMLSVYYAVDHHPDDELGFDTGEDRIDPLMLTRGVYEVHLSVLPHTAFKDTTIDRGAPFVGLGSTNSRAIGQGVIRMAVVVHLKDGIFESLDPPAANRDLLQPTVYSADEPNSDLPALKDSGLSIRDSSTALDLREISAITIGLAIIDDTSMILTASDLEQVAAALPRPEIGELPVEVWEDSDWQSNLDPVARRIASENLRFYQRTFPIQVQ